MYGKVSKISLRMCRIRKKGKECWIVKHKCGGMSVRRRKFETYARQFVFLILFFIFHFILGCGGGVRGREVGVRGSGLVGYRGKSIYNVIR